MLAVDKVDSFFSSLRVRVCANNALRLVQKEINPVRAGNPLSVDGYYILSRIGKGGQCINEFAVDTNEAIEDELFTLSPRINACGG